LKEGRALMQKLRDSALPVKQERRKGLSMVNIQAGRTTLRLLAIFLRKTL